MSVIIGEVETFPATHANKAQVVKILEESAEVFAAWQAIDKCTEYYDGYQCSMYNGGTCDARTECTYVDNLKAECADVIQAVSNLLDALGVDDMRGEMKACEQRNRDRGRFDADVH